MRPIRETRTWFVCILAMLISFSIAWPLAFKFNWTFNDPFTGLPYSPNDNFLFLLIVLAIVLSNFGAIYCAIIRQAASRSR